MPPTPLGVVLVLAIGTEMTGPGITQSPSRHPIAIGENRSPLSVFSGEGVVRIAAVVNDLHFQILNTIPGFEQARMWVFDQNRNAKMPREIDGCLHKAIRALEIPGGLRRGSGHRVHRAQWPRPD